MIKNDQRNQRGVAALLTIVIVSAAALVMAVSATMLGLGELELGYSAQKGSEALAAADGCMEEALRRIRLDTNYGIGAGSMPLTLVNGSCTINITDSGFDRVVQVASTVGDYNKKIEIDLTLSDNDVISINSWDEKDI